MIVRRKIKNDDVVEGGGDIEMEIRKLISDYYSNIEGKEKMIIGEIEKDIEIINRKMCENDGFDEKNIIKKLSKKNEKGNCWYGVEIKKEEIYDKLKMCVWEKDVVKINDINEESEEE
jgi:chaperonin GroEL (HSP60 family)